MMKQANHHQVYVDEGTSSFISGLISIIEKEPNVIQWKRSDRSSYSIIIQSEESLAAILPKYYKSPNVSSFIRQLNLYGFKKLAVRSKDVWEFYHPLFQMDKPENFSKIKRKSGDLKSEGNAHDELIATRAELDELRRENELLMKKLLDYEKKSGTSDPVDDDTGEGDLVPSIRSSKTSRSTFNMSSDSTSTLASLDSNVFPAPSTVEASSEKRMVKRKKGSEKQVVNVDFNKPLLSQFKFPSFSHQLNEPMFPFEISTPPFPSLPVDNFSSSFQLNSFQFPLVPVPSLVPLRCFCGARDCFAAPLSTLSTPSTAFRLGLIHSFMIFIESLSLPTVTLMAKGLFANGLVSSESIIEDPEKSFSMLMSEFCEEGVPYQSLGKVMINLMNDPHGRAIDHALRLLGNLSNRIGLDSLKEEETFSSDSNQNLEETAELEEIKSSMALIDACAEKIRSSTSEEIHEVIDSYINAHERIAYLYKIAEFLGTTTSPKSPEEFHAILSPCTNGQFSRSSSELLLIPIFHSLRSCRLFTTIVRKGFESAPNSGQYVNFMDGFISPDAGILI